MFLEDFTQVFTDIGVCYKFNWNTSQILEASLRGHSGSLSMVLNVQQYDYMNSLMGFGAGVIIQVILIIEF